MKLKKTLHVYTFSLVCVCLAIPISYGQSTGVTAITNQVAFIPCHAFSTGKKVESTVTLIRWFHSSFHKPLYTLDFRRQNSSLSADLSFLHQGRHFPSPETEGRLYIDLAIDPIGLRVDPITQADAGTYTCEIDFRNSRSVQSSVELEVIIPPKEAIIRNSVGLKLKGGIGPYFIGQTIKLKCESLEGHPVPTAEWQIKNGNSERVAIQGPLLIINSLEREDQYSHYTCIVQNNNMTAPKSVTVIIELFLPPLELELQSNIDQPFTAGQTIHVSCICFSSHPKAHIRWEKDNELISAEERIMDNGNITTSFIEFVVRSADDKSVIECSALNPHLPTHVLRRRLYLVVFYPPEVDIVIISNQSRISEGENLVLLCNIKANPEADVIQWSFEDKEFDNSSSIIIINTKLFVKNLTLSHSGKFGCKVTNKFGQKNASLYILVKHKPMCQNAEITYISGHEMNYVNVTCNLDSYPSDVTFYWTFRNSSSNHSWSTDQAPYTRMELQKSNSELLCWGRNEIGVQISPCRILLAQAQESSHLFLPVLLIAIFVAIVVFVSVFFVVRRYRNKYDISSSSSSSDNEMVQLRDVELSKSVIDILMFVSFYMTLCYFIIMKTKYNDNAFGKLLSNCVKQSGAISEGNSSTKLLHPIAKYIDSKAAKQPQMD